MWMLYLALFCIFAITIGFLVYPLRQRYNTLMFATTLSASVISILLYQQLGDAKGYHQMLAQQDLKREFAKARQIMKTPEQVIARLKQRLTEEPDSAKGWYLLGRIYVTTQQYDKALPAFQKALSLDDKNIDYLFNTIQALYWEHGQHRTAQIDQYIENILAQDKYYLPLHLFIAADAAGHEQHRIAIQHWQIVLKQLPVGSQEHTQVMKLMSHSQKIISH